MTNQVEISCQNHKSIFQYLIISTLLDPKTPDCQNTPEPQIPHLHEPKSKTLVMNKLLKRFSFHWTPGVGFENQELVATKVEKDKKKLCALPFWICWTQLLAAVGFGHQWGCDASSSAKAWKELCLKGCTPAKHSYQRGCWHCHHALNYHPRHSIFQEAE